MGAPFGSSPIARKPRNVMFEEAAGVPVTFLTAWHAMHNVAKIQPAPGTSSSFTTFLVSNGIMSDDDEGERAHVEPLVDTEMDAAMVFDLNESDDD